MKTDQSRINLCKAHVKMSIFYAGILCGKRQSHARLCGKCGLHVEFKIKMCFHVHTEKRESRSRSF